MKTKLENALKLTKQAIEQYRKIDERIRVLRNLGFTIEEKPMGSGGVGQIKKMKSGEMRIQIGCGHGRHNYAKCVIL